MGPFVYGTELEPFVSICTSNSSVGFNWENNNWKQTNFYPKKFYVKKINKNSINEIIIDGDYKKAILVSTCKEHVNKKPSVDKEIGKTIYFVCISIKDDKFMKDWDSNKCYETHYSDDYSKDFKRFRPFQGTIKLECDSGIGTRLVFAKNGNFTEITGHTDISEPSDYKDSLVITVGTCADITID